MRVRLAPLPYGFTRLDENPDSPRGPSNPPRDPTRPARDPTRDPASFNPHIPSLSRTTGRLSAGAVRPCDYDRLHGRVGNRPNGL